MDPFSLAVGTSIIGLPGSSLRRGFINSITGLMTGPGTHWAESLVERFTQVSETGFFLKNRNKYLYIMEPFILFLISLFCNICNFILIADS